MSNKKHYLLYGSERYALAILRPLQEAIRARGAEVIRVDGDYDTAVAECRRRAQANGWTIISDTSWEGYETTPRDVMRGYTLLVEEVLHAHPAVMDVCVFGVPGDDGLARPAAVVALRPAVPAGRPARPRRLVDGG